MPRHYGHRKHTPIVSEAQRGLFGAVAGGQDTKATGLSQADAARHLKEVAGKSLPERKRKTTTNALSGLKTR